MARIDCPLCGHHTNSIGIASHWRWHVAQGDAEGVICCYCGEVYLDPLDLKDHRAEIHNAPKTDRPPRVAASRSKRYNQVEQWVNLPYHRFRELVEDRSLWQR